MSAENGCTKSSHSIHFPDARRVSPVYKLLRTLWYIHSCVFMHICWFVTRSILWSPSFRIVFGLGWNTEIQLVSRIVFCFDILLYAMPSGTKWFAQPANTVRSHRHHHYLCGPRNFVFCIANDAIALWTSLSFVAFIVPQVKLKVMWNGGERHTPRSCPPIHVTINGNHKLFIVFTLRVFLLSSFFCLLNWCWADCISIYLQRNFEIVHSHVMCQINIDW